MGSVVTRTLYGAGGAVYAVKEAAYTMFILLFYTQVLGLSGFITGAIISVSLVWDAITDPLVGTWSDRLRSRYGRRHPFMVLSVIPLGIGFLGLFSPPQWAVEHHGLLAAWLLFWSLWIRTFITVFSIPHLALSAEITRDYHERSQVLGARMAFLFLFVVLLPALGLLLIFGEQQGVDGRFDASRYPLYGALSCAVVWVMASVTILGTRRFIVPSDEGSAALGTGQSSQPRLSELFEDLLRTLKNRTFRLLLGYDLATSVSYGAIATLNMLTWTYFWEFSALEVSIILSVPSLLAVGLVLASLRWLGNRWQKHQLVQLALIGMIIDMLWLYPLRLMGVLPDNGTPVIFWLNFAFMMLFMYCFLLRAVSAFSLLADVADEHELEHGVRQEAGFFSIMNFTNKFASIFGPVYSGLALDIIGLDERMLPGEVPQPVLDNLAYAMALGSVPALLLALYFIRGVTLNRARVEQIQAALGARAQAVR